ncbi:putative quinol monooxygenase [Streptoalloteichus hindustanus]|uniref:Quinol monooxygenase YgiN n=1 Tax=Streptoalloteichus hindustanus TaxID=2017 RepID=A0A1M5EPT3_STRHI|nr:putative quinol monooxygenase [Streptoalloteichus hindustanus]SHF81235.1 Quinol monooxygenase YgiN [Streptoalloteichus hindustanus]
MIFIAVRFTVRPERAEEWLSLVEEFTLATRNEPGNVFFEWSRSAETPNQFVLLEGFASPAAGEEHVNSEHFRTAMAWMPEVIATRPDIINVEIPGDGWSEMAELTPVEA